MVDWYKLTLLETAPLTRVNKALYPFTSTGYSLIPQTLEGSDRNDIFVSVFRPPNELLAKIDKANPTTQEWKTIVFPHESEFSQANRITPDLISIRSSPFALVNPALFVNYLSTGNISYVSSSGNNLTFLLSDSKYLDGMDGGPVFITDRNNSAAKTNRCIGLIAGSLKKKSKEGDLTVIVPWNQIVSHLTLASNLPRSPSLIKAVVSSAAQDMFLPWLIFNGVMMIEIHYTNFRKGWGSGILLDETTIVTNMHLLGDDYRTATAWISDDESIPLENLGNPLEGLDMVFFRLTKPISSRRKANPVTLYSGEYKVGQRVRSLGYGLIYPHRTGNQPFQPLTAHGIISKCVSMDLYRQLDQSTMSVVVGEEADERPVLLVSTAGCWNGSSGGALFDLETGHVVSMMTSNGSVNDTGEVIPQLAFSLSSNVLQYALTLVRKGIRKKVSNRVTQLWKLDETHVSSLVETSPSLQAKL